MTIHTRVYHNKKKKTTPKNLMKMKCGASWLHEHVKWSTRESRHVSG